MGVNIGATWGYQVDLPSRLSIHVGDEVASLYFFIAETDPIQQLYTLGSGRGKLASTIDYVNSFSVGYL